MKTGTTKEAGFPLRAYTKKEIRLMYGISEDKFRLWLHAIKEIPRGSRKNLLDIDQVQAVLNKYGVPGEREFD